MDDEQYPTLRLLMRHGKGIAIAAAAFGVICGLWAAVALQAWGFAAVGVIAGGVFYALVRSYVELITLVTDMLLPK